MEEKTKREPVNETVQGEQPETTPETAPGQLKAETPSVEEKEPLVKEMKEKLLTCAEEGDCLNALVARFEEMAKRLDVPTNRLIEEVFSFLTHKNE